VTGVQTWVPIYPRAVVVDRAGLAVQELRCAFDGGAVGDGDGLQAQAHAEQRDSSSRLVNQIDAAAGVLGGAGAGRQEDAVIAVDAADVVIAAHFALSAELRQVL